MIKKNIYALLAMLGFVTFSTQATATMPTNVSIIELIANPEKYDQKLVRIIGFLRLKFEGNAIYLNESDYKNAISKNGLWVNVGSLQSYEKLNEKYVLIEGVFDSKDSGHMGMWSGAISNITRLEIWSDPKDPISTH